jgi:hypothetical protein
VSRAWMHGTGTAPGSSHSYAQKFFAGAPSHLSAADYAAPMASVQSVMLPIPV